MGVIVHDFTTDTDITIQNSHSPHNTTTYILKIDTIVGSQDPTRLNEISITSWPWGERQSAEAAGGGSTVKVKPLEFQFTIQLPTHYPFIT